MKMTGNVGFEDLTAVAFNVTIISRIQVEFHRYFLGMYCLHLQGLIFVFFADCLVELSFDPENGGSMFRRNVWERLPDRTASHSRTGSQFKASRLWVIK
jgi:hypothetical protein